MLLKIAKSDSSHADALVQIGIYTQSADTHTSISNGTSVFVLPELQSVNTGNQ
jgi:hypothetical protein